MTIDEICIELDQRFVRMGWHLVDHGRCIRRFSSDGVRIHCPLSALATQIGDYPVGMVDYGAFEQVLGLSRRDAFLIVDAADHKQCDDKPLRQKLLSACGLNGPRGT